MKKKTVSDGSDAPKHHSNPESFQNINGELQDSWGFVWISLLRIFTSLCCNQVYQVEDREKQPIFLTQQINILYLGAQIGIGIGSCSWFLLQMK